jgi:hypothetical protein
MKISIKTESIRPDAHDLCVRAFKNRIKLHYTDRVTNKINMDRVSQDLDIIMIDIAKGHNFRLDMDGNDFIFRDNIFGGFTELSL